MLQQQPSAALRERIGRYQVLRKIATGGMAELFLARQVGLDGFEKVVAIKRILAHLAHDREFVQMFQDEARIVAKLHHPNIVQIYDLGKADDTYFIAMEYIAGRNLSSIAKKARAKGRLLPPTHIAHCISQACEGLYYAHTRHDINGHPLQIVHRDVSPQNIIVSFSGAVKLVDFGIAKAATKIAHTRAGVLKGKYAYMSPEQIRGQPTDGRSDLFAVGIVLYELLCGRRPFEEENSIQTLKSIVQDDPTPCQQLNDAIPDALAAIIDRCLQKDVEARFQSAQDVQLALEDYVSTSPQRINNLVIGQWITALFEEDLSKKHGARMNLPGLGDIVLPDPPPSSRPPPGSRSGSGSDDGDPEAAPSASDSRPSLPLSRGRGGGSVVGREPSDAEPAGADELDDPPPSDGRSDLIEEGIIQRSPSAARGASPADASDWDRASTVHGNGEDDRAAPVAASAPVASADDATRPEPVAAGPAPADALPAEPLRSGSEDDVDTVSPDADDARDRTPMPLLDGGQFLVALPDGPSGSDDPSSADPFGAPTDDLWDESTAGLPEAAAAVANVSPDDVRRGGGPAKGRARSVALSAVARRRAARAAIADPDFGSTGPARADAPPSAADDARSDAGPLSEAGEALSDGPPPLGWDALVSGAEEERDTLGYDEPWADKTVSDPHDNSARGAEVAIAPTADVEGAVASEAIADDPVFADDEDEAPPVERTIAQAIFDEEGIADPTVDQAVIDELDDATVDQAEFGPRTRPHAAPTTSSGAGQAGRPPASTAEVTIAGARLVIESGEFNDDLTVGYQDEFSPWRQASSSTGARPDERGATSTGIGMSPSEHESTAVADPDAAPLAARSPSSTRVTDFADEPELPSPSRAGTSGAVDDGRTVAGVISDDDDTPESPLVDPGPLGRASDPPTHGLPPIRDPAAPAVARPPQPKGPEAETELADEMVTTGGEPSFAGRGLVVPAQLGFGERSPDLAAEPVRPSPMEPPPGEEDGEDSFQDEYSALVVQPNPLMPSTPDAAARPAMAIGSTNVPPANLSLSDVLAHPPNAPRARIAALPRVETVKPATPPRSPPPRSPSAPRARPSSIRTGSMVGRQIREVVRSAEPPSVHGPRTNASRLPAPVESLGRGAEPRLDPAEPRLDLQGALDVSPYEQAPPAGRARSPRRWLAPVLAAASAVLLGIAVYMAFPYLLGPKGPHLTIKTTPVGARVLVDGTAQRGLTPITISGLSTKVTYEIRLEREGYDPVVRLVELPEDGPLIWQIPLRPSSQK